MYQGLRRTLLVRRFERIRDLPGNGQCLVQRNGSMGNAIRERRAFDEFEH